MDDQEKGEISKEVFPLENILYIIQEEGRPINKKDLKGRQMVVPLEVFKNIGYITVLLKSGIVTDFSTEECGEIDLIISPEDLGDPIE